MTKRPLHTRPLAARLMLSGLACIGLVASSTAIAQPDCEKPLAEPSVAGLNWQLSTEMPDGDYALSIEASIDGAVVARQSKALAVPPKSVRERVVSLFGDDPV